MSGKVKIDVEANVSSAKKALRSLESDIKKTSRSAEKYSGKSGRSGFNSGTGNRDLKSAFSELASSKLKGLDKFGIADKLGKLGRLGGYAGAAIAPIMAAYGVGKWGEMRAEKGKEYYSRELTLNQSLGQISKNMGGSGFVANLSKDLIDLGIKGKTPFEELTRSAQKLMLAFKGNQSEVKKWVNLIADMSAGTGESASFFTELIVKAQQFGTVENESIKQLSEKGIPIYKTLADLLGVSSNEAKKIAEQGKITADQFKKAAEQAVKISVAGSNNSAVLKDSSYYEKQKQELENAVYSSTYTKQMEEMKTRHAKQRAEKAASYYEENDVATMHEELARVTTAIIEVIEIFKDNFEDFSFWFGKTVGKLMAFASHHLNDKQNIDAQNAINKLASYTIGHNAGMQTHKISLADLVYNMEDGNSVAALSSRIEEIKSAIQTAEKEISDSYVDENRRKNGQAVIEEAKQHLAILEATLEKKQKDISLEEERQRKAKKALELQTQYLTNEAKNPEDYLKAWNLNSTQRFKSISDAQNAYKASIAAIKSGSGTEEDESIIKHFKPMQGMIEAQENGRKDFELSERASAGDLSAKFELEFSKTFKTMEKLGYTVDEMQKFATEKATSLKAQASTKLQTLEPKQTDLLTSIKEYEDKLNWHWCTKTDGADKINSYERGAWGQGLKLQHYDPALLTAKQQLHAMQEQSKSLQCQINLTKQELNAISKINLIPRAI